MKKQALKYWILAARPKTLSASVMPVLVASALAWSDGAFRWQPALICFLFALAAQIVSNFLNDYFDFVKGSDREDRLGPERAVAQGWISAKSMLYGAVLLMGIACLLGCSIIYYAGWEMILVGVAVCLGVFFYSAGPYPLAYRGWGDCCVLLFYGLIPVGFTYYTQALEWTWPVTICGIALGLVSTNILVANNYRDREQDLISRKYTTIVLFGEKFGRYFYLLNGVVAVTVCLLLLFFTKNQAAVLPAIYLIPHILVWKKMSRIRTGKELNCILGESARNVVLFGLLLIAGLLVRLI